MPNNFRELEVRRRAHDLVLACYKATQEFPAVERFCLSQQIRRSALSMVSNIAEGKGRRSDREYRSFLVNARGSAFELDAQILIARDLAYLPMTTADLLSEETAHIARMLNGILRHLANAS